MRTVYSWTLPGTTISLGRRTQIMGILNVTPDSFSDGGSFVDPSRAAARALEMEAEGADILDIGGESSRPGSTPIPEEEELRRIMPVLDQILGRIQIPVSVDTYRSGVARRAIEAGVKIVNDISGFRFDPKLADVVGKSGAGVVLMHSRGSREELHVQPPPVDAVGQVVEDLREAVGTAIKAGVSRSSIVVDPGIGFGKRAEDSLAVLRNLSALSPLECPVLVGTSRKSFIRKIAGIESATPHSQLWGTAATVAMAICRGAHILRVHDIREMKMLSKVLDAILDQEIT